MQQILPIFPQDIKMVNYQVGFKSMDDFVHYFVNGMPVYCHELNDKNGYRYVLATLVNHNFCSIKELSNALGVNMYILIENYTTFPLKSIPLIEVKPVALQIQQQHKNDDKHGYKTRDYQTVLPGV